MTVGITALSFASGLPNSHEAHLPQLVHHLVALNDGTRYVLFVRKDNCEVFPAPSANVRHVVFPRACRYKAVQVFCEQVVVPLLLAVLRADLLHFPTNVRPLFLPCSSVGTIHWVLTPTITRAFALPKRLYSAFFEPMSVRKANRLIAVSRACKDDLVAQGVPAGKIEVIEHGISDRFQPHDPDTKWLAEHSIRAGYILHVGSAAPYKNLARLLRAYVLARSEGKTRAQLVLVGSVGPSDVQSILTREEERELSGDVICLGFTPYPEMPRVYWAARTCISVSLQETFGVALLEAMASGVPLVLSSLPAHEEVAGGAAFFVDPHDVAGIATAIGKVDSDESLRRDLSERGLARAKQFDWTAAARKTRAVYAATLSR